MSDTDTDEEQKPNPSADRTGPCEAVKCRDRCENFAYHGVMDFFRMCVCGHTQQSHSREA